jgi:hypothetical protein
MYICYNSSLEIYMGLNTEIANLFSNHMSDDKFRPIHIECVLNNEFKK